MAALYKIMKMPLTFIVCSILIGASFIFGAKLGANKMWAHTQSLQALYAAREIQFEYQGFDTVEEIRESLDYDNYANLLEAILEYGRYLNHWNSKVPILGTMDDSTKTFYKEAISFYLDTRYQPSKLSQEESVKKVIDEMLAEGKIKPEFVDEISKYLLESRKEHDISFERAISNVIE